MFTIKFFIKKIKKFCFLSVKPLDKKGGGGWGGGIIEALLLYLFVTAKGLFDEHTTRLQCGNCQRILHGAF